MTAAFIVGFAAGAACMTLVNWVADRILERYFGDQECD